LFSSCCASPRFLPSFPTRRSSDLSLVFYGWWDIAFVPLLVGSFVVNWLLAKLYQRTQVKAVLIAAIALNLAVLAYCKYAAFLVRSEEHTSELQSLTNLVCRLLLAN